MEKNGALPEQEPPTLNEHKKNGLVALAAKDAGKSSSANVHKTDHHQWIGYLTLMDLERGTIYMGDSSQKGCKFHWRESTMFDIATSLSSKCSFVQYL